MKRHEALIQLSRDHHFGLLLCWKIKEGLKRETDVSRIADYIRYFYQSHLQAHFAEEEQYVFGLLGNDHPLIVEAVSQHRELENMVENTLETPENLAAFKDLLEKHIRFEERQVFQEIQEQATEAQLQELLKLPFHDLQEPEWQDQFWR